LLRIVWYNNSLKANSYYILTKGERNEDMDKTLKIAKEFTYDKIGGYRKGNPFTIAFVYPQSGEACIVKGGLNDVQKYVKENYPIAIINYQFFHKGQHRGYHSINGEKEGYYISFKKSAPSYRQQEYNSGFGYSAKQGHRCQVTVRHYENESGFKKELRRLPRCWMKELNPYVGA
jgi:hypothetical protein